MGDATEATVPVFDPILTGPYLRLQFADLGFSRFVEVEALSPSNLP